MYEQLARVGKAVSAPKRLELLDLLGQGPRTVEALAGQAALSVANASRHLQILRRAGLVESRKQGLFVEYRLASDAVGRFFLELRGLAHERIPETGATTRRYLARRGATEPVHGAELLERVRRGEVTVIDVRPPEEYRAGHLPGAFSIPIGELEARLSELPRRREIVAYCRGPYCVMALDAVEILRREGLRARRLEEGVAEWRARGWALEDGPAPAPSAGRLS